MLDKNTDDLPDSNLYKKKELQKSEVNNEKSSTKLPQKPDVKTKPNKSTPTPVPKGGLAAAIAALQSKQKSSSLIDVSKKQWTNFKTKNNLEDELKTATDAGKGAQHGFDIDIVFIYIYEYFNIYFLNIFILYNIYIM